VNTSTAPAPELVAIMRFARHIDTYIDVMASDELDAWNTEMDILQKRLEQGYRITDKRSFKDSIVGRYPTRRQ
jgi:hypothetical protein